MPQVQPAPEERLALRLYQCLGWLPTSVVIPRHFLASEPLWSLVTMTEEHSPQPLVLTRKKPR